MAKKISLDSHNQECDVEIKQLNITVTMNIEK